MGYDFARSLRTAVDLWLCDCHFGAWGQLIEGWESTPRMRPTMIQFDPGSPRSHVLAEQHEMPTCFILSTNQGSILLAEELILLHECNVPSQPWARVSRRKASC